MARGRLWREEGFGERMALAIGRLWREDVFGERMALSIGRLWREDVFGERMALARVRISLHMRKIRYCEYLIMIMYHGTKCHKRQYS